MAQTPPDPSSEIAALRAQISAMTQRLNDLEQRTQAPAPTPPSVPPPSTPTPPSTPVEIGGDRSTPPGPLSRALTGLGQEVEILAAADSSRVSFKATRQVSATRLGKRSEGWAHTTRWTSAVSAPLAKGDPRTELWTQDGFASDFQFTLGLSRFFRYLRNPLLDKQLLGLTEQARLACATTKTPAECKAAEEAAPGDAFVRAFLGDDKQAEYLDLAASPSAHAFGGELSVGYLKHKYVNPTLVANEASTDTPWGIKGYYAYMPRRDTSYVFSLQHVDQQKDQDAGVQCPTPPASPFNCLSGALGAPKDQKKLIWGLEYRRLFELPFTDDEQPLFRAIGIAPQVLHDSRSDVTSLDLPIYFVPNEKGEYIGGVRLGWNSKDHDVVAGLFVNRAFGVRP